MLQETVARVADRDIFEAPLVICNEAHRFIIAEQLRASGTVPRAILLEPEGRNTAPAAAVAALALGDEDSLMLVLPSDHVIADWPSFLDAVRLAARAARGGALVSFGVRPDRAETGYGYIERGRALDGLEGAYEVARFVEKPDRDAAERYLASGELDWNSGMFLFSARRYLEEMERLSPAVVAACRAALEKAEKDLDFLRLDAESFTASPSDSIDYAVMERTRSAAVVPISVGWSDVGSFAALWDIGERDGDGNLLRGDVTAIDLRDCYVRSDDVMIAAMGLTGIVIVSTPDAVLVVPKERSQEIKTLVEALGPERLDALQTHRKVHRPWGSYEAIGAGDRYQVKRITVNPGQRLSLQTHHHRAEHWVVVHGTARVTREDEIFLLRENESTYIPREATHRLENAGDGPLRIIEVQSGDYLGEDDITRLEDEYGRR
jgi:mannose-1-phosphate guanylyltransferase/mannose-1-phosphate guanylyltransferase/mannose-6-phosphate isomerase